MGHNSSDRCSLSPAVSIAAEPAKRKPDKQRPLKPLTYANVVSFFKEARFRPVEVQKRCTVFYRRRMEERKHLRLLSDYRGEF